MPVNETYLAVFEEDCAYHIYNRTNNKELLFRSDDNREFFLQQFFNYLNPFIDVFCYCLLPNHFHFMIRVKAKASIKEYLQSLPDKELKDIHRKYLGKEMTSLAKPNAGQKMSSLPTIHHIIESAFRSFFISYSMAFNRYFNRTGNLFQRSFKRVEIEKDDQFTKTIIYIHTNPLKHKITHDFTAYHWSSYHEIIRSRESEVSPLAASRSQAKGDTSIISPSAAKELIDWFGNTERFIRDHATLFQYYRDVDSAIEDER